MSEPARKPDGDRAEELEDQLRECEETRQRLEKDNEMLRESSETFGDLADRLAEQLTRRDEKD